jgi:hypothetical protein
MAVVGAAILLIRYNLIRVPLLSPDSDTYSIELEPDTEHGGEQDTAASDAEKPQAST